MNYLLHLLVYLNIYIILAMSLNVLVGYCGMMTLAHASFYAIGAYVYAIISLTLNWSFLPALALAALVAGVLSLALSVPSWRLKSDFFVVLSLAVQVLLFSLIYNWHNPNAPIGTWANLTNGSFGISGVPKPVIAGCKFDTIGSMAFLSGCIAALCIVACWLLLNSPWGRVLRAMRDDELAARTLGKNTRALIIQASAVSCSIAAIGGATYASYVNYVDPTLASLDFSILLLSMVIVGGVGNFRGPLIGAAVLLGIPEALRFLEIPSSMAAEIRLMAYGLLLILVVHFRPQGIAGCCRIE